MKTTIKSSQIELVQGTDDQDRTFGYVHGEDGGFFFTWHNTLDTTIASIEEDEVDGDGGLNRSDVVEFLEDYLPTTKRGQRIWS